MATKTTGEQTGTSPSKSVLLPVIITLFGLLVFRGGDALNAQSPNLARPTAVEPPIGTVVAYAGQLNSIPGNWILCDGRPLSREDPRYRALFSAIGTSWGGDGSPNFHLPDLMGRFLRGVDKDAQGTAPAAPRDPDRDARTASNPAAGAAAGNAGNNVGSMQDDAVQTHTHADPGHTHAADITVNHEPIAKHEGEEVESGNGARVQGNEGNNGFLRIGVTVRNLAAMTGIGGPATFKDVTPRVSTETRPKNAYVYWIIRYK